MIENSTIRPQVSVIHPGRQQSTRTALALQKAGLLSNYITRLYYDSKLFPFSLICKNKTIKKILDQKLSGRRIDGLSTDKICLLGRWRGISDPLIARNRNTAKLLSLDRYPFKSFLHKAGCLAAKNSNAIICYDGRAYHSFKVANAYGLKKILIMTAPHIILQDRIAKEEITSHPDFAKTISKRSCIFNKNGLRPLIDEVLMSDRIIVSSGISKDSLIELGVSSEKIDFVPLGVNSTHFSKCNIQKRNKFNFNILYVGKIDQMKGIKYLLEAVRILNLPNIKVHMIGPKTGEVSSLRPYSHFLKILNPVSFGLMPSIYEEADIFVFPSIVEGFGRVLLEAMAAGLPIIATSNTAANYVIDDGIDGFTVPPRDINALIERIRLLYKNVELRIDFGTKARAKAKRYTWEKYENGIVNSVLKTFKTNSQQRRR